MTALDIVRHLSTHTILICVLILAAIVKYEYEIVQWCRATEDYQYAKDLIIAEDEPCRSRADVYSHRLDCDQIFRDIDPALRNANVRRCWWDNQPLHRMSWTTIAIMIVVPLLLARWSLSSWTALRQTQIEGESIRASLRNFGRYLGAHAEDEE